MSSKEDISKELLQATEEDDIPRIAGLVRELEETETHSSEDKLSLVYANKYLDQNGFEGLKKWTEDIVGVDQPTNDLPFTTKVVINSGAGLSLQAISETNRFLETPDFFGYPAADTAAFVLGYMASDIIINANLGSNDSAQYSSMEDYLDINGTDVLASDNAEEMRARIDQDYDVDTYGI